MLESTRGKITHNTKSLSGGFFPLRYFIWALYTSTTITWIIVLHLLKLRIHFDTGSKLFANHIFILFRTAETMCQTVW